MILLLLMTACAQAFQATPPIANLGGEDTFKFGTTVVSNRGFRGQVYHLKEGSDHLPNFKKLKPVGPPIYTPYLNVPPQSFTKGFPGVTKRFEWFAIDYEGRFWVPKQGRYMFALISDDGAKLYIDGKTIIDNDGLHPPQQTNGGVTLSEGVHIVRVSYFQGPRTSLALMLGVAGPDDREPNGTEKLRVFNLEEFKPPPDVDWDKSPPGKVLKR